MRLGVYECFWTTKYSVDRYLPNEVSKEAHSYQARPKMRGKRTYSNPLRENLRNIVSKLCYCFYRWIWEFFRSMEFMSLFRVKPTRANGLGQVGKSKSESKCYNQYPSLLRPMFVIRDFQPSIIFLDIS